VGPKDVTISCQQKADNKEHQKGYQNRDCTAKGTPANGGHTGRAQGSGSHREGGRKIGPRK